MHYIYIYYYIHTIIKSIPVLGFGIVFFFLLLSLFVFFFFLVDGRKQMKYEPMIIANFLNETFVTIYFNFKNHFVTTPPPWMLILYVAAAIVDSYG